MTGPVTMTDPPVALVTGAGSGIGRSTALRLAGIGSRVIIADINAIRAAETVELIATAGGTASGVELDVSDPDAVDACVDGIVARHGRLDVLVNNAAILDSVGPIGETTNAEWNRVIAVNLTGCFNVSRAAIPALLDTGGNIVNVASVAGLSGGRGGGAYTASKHGVIGLTRSVAFMYADRGIRCNAVCPGPVTTNIRDSAPGALSEFGLERMALVRASGRPSATADEIADVILFLASPQATHLNGAIIAADGGWLAG